MTGTFDVILLVDTSIESTMKPQRDILQGKNSQEKFS